MKEAWLRGALALSLLLNAPVCVMAAQTKQACAGCCSKTCCVVDKPTTPSIVPNGLVFGIAPVVASAPASAPEFSLVPAGPAVFYAPALADCSLARGPPRA